MGRNKGKVEIQIQSVSEGLGWRGRVFPYLFAPLIFLSIASLGGRVFTICLVAVLLLFGIGKRPVAQLK